MILCTLVFSTGISHSPKSFCLFFFSTLRLVSYFCDRFKPRIAIINFLSPTKFAVLISFFGMRLCSDFRDAQK
jgi:hypothetical protein